MWVLSLVVDGEVIQDAADLEVRALTVAPTSLAAQANRAFLRRTVSFLADQGIDQFLDIGSGIPTLGSVHEVAQGMNPEARVVYIDIDPIAVNHSQAIVQGNPHAIALQADVRQPDRILAHPDVQRLLDFQRPMGVLLLLLMHFIADDDEAYRIVAFLRDALAPGSYLQRYGQGYASRGTGTHLRAVFHDKRSG